MFGEMGWGGLGLGLGLILESEIKICIFKNLFGKSSGAGAYYCKITKNDIIKMLSSRFRFKD